MYQVRTPNYSKSDQGLRWALPDRVFFACGACHILAYAFLERHGQTGHEVVWIKPSAGFIGSHIVVCTADWVFDYHGYSTRRAFFSHTWRRACQRWPGWDATLRSLPAEILICEKASRTFQGLWLREPAQFLHDAMPRARRFLARFPSPQNAGNRLSPDTGQADGS